MAIQTDITTRFGLIESAYCRLSSIEWQEPAMELRLGLKVYANKSAREQHLEPLEIRHFLLPLSEAMASAGGGSMIAFSYDFMRTIDPQLAEGVNV